MKITFEKKNHLSKIILREATQNNFIFYAALDTYGIRCVYVFDITSIILSMQCQVYLSESFLQGKKG